jgi:hypothetical protein
MRSSWHLPSGIDLERHYLGKLIKEIHTERIRRADRQTLNFASRIV